MLACVARGLSNAEIARELDMTEATAKTHVSRDAGRTRPAQPRPGGHPVLRDVDDLIRPSGWSTRGRTARGSRPRRRACWSPRPRR
ncbi:LuxR C-terminal-related transcriptional regulator [Sphaerisporangium sp. NPDC049002]|uniref:LuxR C-terminal-related transcriptional regulator n=1 Tax=Sphaerisporangium sp. NPDC049002 TaxID=3155392 RepID=UPI0033D764CF